MLGTLRRDIRVIFERDPAAKSLLEVLLCYPGLHALWFHRVSHRFYRWRLYTLARLVSHLGRFFTGVEIHPAARIGPGFFIDHGMGVVIGETSEIGENVTVYQGVTLGGTGQERGKRHPTIRDQVVLGVGAKVLGDIEVGQHSKIGAGAVVIESVPPNCTVVGVPGRVVVRDGERVRKRMGLDLEHGDLPDPLTELLERLDHHLRQLQVRAAALEARLEDPADPARSEAAAPLSEGCK